MSFDWRPESKDRYFRKAEAAVKSIAGMQEQSGGRDEFGKKKKTIFIHAYMVLEMEEQDR